MTNLIKITLTLCLMIQGFVFGQSNELNVLNTKYDHFLEQQNKGVAILVKNDGINHTASVGSHDLNENNVFNIGSATKTFTVILLMQEVEKGNIRLSDKIGKYLDPIDNVDGSLSIKTLMTHESGLDEVVGRNIEEIFYANSDSLYEQDLLTQIEEYDPEMIGKFDYCNTNYLLLGRLLENVTGEDYFELLKKRIFEPLKLTSTYPYVYKDAPNLATPFHEDEDVTEYLDYRYFANIAHSAGSIASTLVDMEKFYTGLFETEILVSNESLKAMKNDGNEVYGLGLFKDEYDGADFYGHGGNNIGYSFANGYNPETKELYLMFSNDRKVPFKAIIRGDLIDFMNGVNIDTDGLAINAKDYESVLGHYMLEEANLVLEIMEEDGILFMVSEAQGVKSQLLKKSDNVLFDATVGATLELIEGSNDSLKFAQNGFETTIKRIDPSTLPTEAVGEAIDMSIFETIVGKYLLKEADLVLELVSEDGALYLVSEAQGAKSKLLQKNSFTLIDNDTGVTLELIEGNMALKFNQNGFETTINRIEPSKESSEPTGKVEAIDKTIFETMVGKYLLKEANLVLEVVSEDGALYLVSEAQGAKSKLQHKTSTTVVDNETGVVLELIEGDKNTIKFTQNGFETTISRF